MVPLFSYYCQQINCPIVFDSARWEPEVHWILTQYCWSQKKWKKKNSRNLSNRGLILDISDGSVRIRIVITGDSLMTKDDELVKSLRKTQTMTSLFQHELGAEM